MCQTSYGETDRDMISHFPFHLVFIPGKRKRILALGQSLNKACDHETVRFSSWLQIGEKGGAVLTHTECQSLLGRRWGGMQESLLQAAGWDDEVFVAFSEEEHFFLHRLLSWSVVSCNFIVSITVFLGVTWDKWTRRRSHHLSFKGSYITCILNTHHVQGSCLVAMGIARVSKIQMSPTPKDRGRSQFFLRGSEYMKCRYPITFST